MTDDTFLFPGRENRSDRPGLKFRIKVERWERREGGREGGEDRPRRDSRCKSNVKAVDDQSLVGLGRRPPADVHRRAFASMFAGVLTPALIDRQTRYEV